MGLPFAPLHPPRPGGDEEPHEEVTRVPRFRPQDPPQLPSCYVGSVPAALLCYTGSVPGYPVGRTGAQLVLNMLGAEEAHSTGNVGVDFIVVFLRAGKILKAKGPLQA